MKDKAEPMQRVAMPGLRRQDLPADRLGLRRLPRLVQALSLGGEESGVAGPVKQRCFGHLSARPCCDPRSGGAEYCRTCNSGLSANLKRGQDLRQNW